MSIHLYFVLSGSILSQHFTHTYLKTSTGFILRECWLDAKDGLRHLALSDDKSISPYVKSVWIEGTVLTLNVSEVQD